MHVDSQGSILPLPDAHSTIFPVLTLPNTPVDSSPTRQPQESATKLSQIAYFETFVHRLLTFTSLPVNLLIPPYSISLPPIQDQSQPSRIGKIAMHPELPVVALSQAQSGGSIFLFDLRTNAYLKYKLTLPSAHLVNCLAFSKYNFLAAGTSKGDVLLFDLDLSIKASGSKPSNINVIPSLVSLIPPQFPSLSLLGEVSSLSFDHISGRYLAITTTRSGTWVHDTIYSWSTRLSKYPSSFVTFSPREDLIAIARERTGEIEVYTLIRAGMLSFSVPTVVSSSVKSAVVCMQWLSDGKSLLCSNDGNAGMRILHAESQSESSGPPGMLTLRWETDLLVVKVIGDLATPLRVTASDGIPYGGVPTGFAVDKTFTRLVVSYSKSPLLEVFALRDIGEGDIPSIGLIRGPMTGKSVTDKSRGKRPEGQSPFEDSSWDRSICVDLGFVGQALGGKNSLFASAWNGETGGKLSFVAFYRGDLSM